MTDIAVDLTIMVEEQFTLPTWTVSLVCCGMMMMMMAVPIILHVRYNKSGLKEEKIGLIPTMKTSVKTQK